MKKEEIHIGDIKRWLIGQTTPAFMIEVAIRTVLIYLILLAVIRLFGKRMTGQITLVELSVMITLGAIVSPVMQLPDRGIMFGVVVLLVALFFQRGLNYLSFKNERIEHFAEGKLSVLVKDGLLMLDEMKKTQISRYQLFSMLREKKIQNLGKVKRGYLEACGVLSIYEMSQTKPGLPVFPSSDPAIRGIQHELDNHVMACCNCGHVQTIISESTTCDICHTIEWSKAYLQTN